MACLESTLKHVSTEGIVYKIKNNLINTILLVLMSYYILLTWNIFKVMWWPEVWKILTEQIDDQALSNLKQYLEI